MSVIWVVMAGSWSWGGRSLPYLSAVHDQRCHARTADAMDGGIVGRTDGVFGRRYRTNIRLRRADFRKKAHAGTVFLDFCIRDEAPVWVSEEGSRDVRKTYAACMPGKMQAHRRGDASPDAEIRM